jgi:hypothetical protein
MIRKITGVAARNRTDGTLVWLHAPARHHLLFPKIKELGHPKDFEQGFIDQDYNFLNRWEAYALAVTNGQLNRKDLSYRGCKLLSEDVW